MEQLKLVITQQGLRECINAQADGLQAQLKWVSAGDEAYTPSVEQTALRNELQRVEFYEYKPASGAVAALQATAKFSGPQEYAIRELGFWLASGTLFGVISIPDTTLNYKPKHGHCIQPFTLDLTALPSDTVTVVVGTENLNILIDEEFTKMATAQVDTMHRQTLQEFRLLDLDKRAEALKGAKSEDSKLLAGKAPAYYAKQTGLDATNQALNSVITQLTAVFDNGTNLINGI